MVAAPQPAGADCYPVSGGCGRRSSSQAYSTKLSASSTRSLATEACSWAREAMSCRAWSRSNRSRTVSVSSIACSGGSSMALRLPPRCASGASRAACSTCSSLMLPMLPPAADTKRSRRFKAKTGWPPASRRGRAGAVAPAAAPAACDRLSSRRSTCPSNPARDMAVRGAPCRVGGRHEPPRCTARARTGRVQSPGPGARERAPTLSRCREQGRHSRRRRRGAVRNHVAGL